MNVASKSSNAWRLVILCILIVLIIALHTSGISTHLSITSIKNNFELLVHYKEHYYSTSVTLFILTYIISTALFLPSAATLAFVSGLLFNSTWGTIYSIIGGTLGAIVAFLLVRFILGSWLQARYAQKLQKFNSAFHERGAYYLTSLRLMSIMPFFVVNILAGLTEMRIFTFIWTTIVGILPGSFLFAYAGGQLQRAQHIGDSILNPNIITFFFLLTIITLLPMVSKKLSLSRQKQRNDCA